MDGLQYGAFKPLVGRKVGRIMTLRQLVPAGFVTTLLGAAVAGIFWQPAWLAALGLAGVYVTAVLVSSARAFRSHGVRCAAALTLVFPVIHFSYGLGFLRGLRDGLFGRPSRWRDPATVPLSR
jgi:hypothetical protein